MVKLNFDKIDKEKMISLYCHEKKTLRDIGKIYGVGHITIRRVLKENNILIKKWHGKKIMELQCDYCQKPIFRYPSTISKNRGNFCSYVCMYTWQREGNMPRGEKSYNWKGGITAISSDNLKTPEFRALKKIVLENFPLCVICGDTFCLHVHHIKTRREYPKLVFELNNLITLCRYCHSRIKGKEHSWEPFFSRIVYKGGELLENPNVKVEGNQQPSQLNVISMVDWKVQRLTVEESQSNKTDTSAAHESEEIVRTYVKA